MLKAIHAQESKEAARKKAAAVTEELQNMKLKEAAKKVSDSVEEPITYMDFPSEHWLKIRTNNVIERLNREIRRRTRVVGTSPGSLVFQFNNSILNGCAKTGICGIHAWLPVSMHHFAIFSINAASTLPYGIRMVPLSV